ncbi:hypothetical protein T492DRAFT_30149 [Pavlovales sp. CCMP2436]|nr:hypothetical protein T492DRAFT_30149 [Pavlovales sp. CCMP2436]
MAPEVAAGEAPSASSDVYAFGMCVVAALAADDATFENVLSSSAHALECAQAPSGAAASGGGRADVLVLSLAEDPSARPSPFELCASALFSAADALIAAEEVAREVVTIARLRWCAVCFEHMDMGEGATCSLTVQDETRGEGAHDVSSAGLGAEAHFACCSCLAAHVSASCEPECLGAFGQNGGYVRCVHAGEGCARIYSIVAVANLPCAACLTFWQARSVLDEERITKQVRTNTPRHTWNNMHPFAL